MLTLLPGEEIITRSNNDVLVLTNQRLCYQYSGYSKTVMLEHITSCESVKTNPVALLYVAGGMVFFAFLLLTMPDKQGGAQVGLFFAFALVIAYFIAKTDYITIRTPGDKIKIPNGGMSGESSVAFINKIEAAKHARMVALK